MKAFFASLTYADLKLTDGKQIVAAFKKGVFETDNPKVIEYLRKCKAECVEVKAEAVRAEKPEAVKAETDAKEQKAPHIGKLEPEPPFHTTPNPHKAGV